jgi:hypothetical protein
LPYGGHACRKISVFGKRHDHVMRDTYRCWMTSKDLFDGMNRERRSLNLPRRRTPRRSRCIHRSLAARLDPVPSLPSIFLTSWPCKRRAADLRNLAMEGGNCCWKMDPATGGSLADPLGQAAPFCHRTRQDSPIYPPAGHIAANPARPPNEKESAGFVNWKPAWPRSNCTCGTMRDTVEAAHNETAS